ncbi:MAG: hypothetical protein ACO3E3_05075 [Candidatus Limnocylindrus sp.]
MTPEHIKAQLRDAADELMDAEFAVSEKRRRRDELIRAASVAGLSLRAIGDLCLVSHQTVANIIAAGSAQTTTPSAEPASQEA